MSLWMVSRIISYLLKKKMEHIEYSVLRVLRKATSQVNTPHNPKKIANKRFMVDLC